MTQTKYVQGFGGGKGGGGGNTPTESDDTLQSIQFANVLDLVSEGEIQGLDDGYKSIFLDNTPVQNADGTDNFSTPLLHATALKVKRTFQATLDQRKSKDQLASR